MAKGDQRSNKMAKKPKKDTSPPRDSTSDRPTPPMTTVLPKGKLKNKYLFCFFGRRVPLSADSGVGVPWTIQG
jgi:hypothetical protein